MRRKKEEKIKKSIVPTSVADLGCLSPVLAEKHRIPDPDRQH
jgi:hypothetical protein